MGTIRRQALAVFALLLFCYCLCHQGRGWNQNSRLDLLHAIFLNHTFKIDAFHENTGDKAVHNGHYYSDKGPGIAFLALPAYTIATLSLRATGLTIHSPEGWLLCSWVTTVGSVALITALGGAAMFVFLSRFVKCEHAFLTTVAIYIGSLPFPYATMLFSHSAVIGLLSIALWALTDAEYLSRNQPLRCAGTKTNLPTADEMPRERLGARKALLAGLACGFAIASEYTAALAAAGILVFAFIVSTRAGLMVVVGSISPLLLIPVYNMICFGSPLNFGYHNLATPEFQAMNDGLFGITFPPKIDATYLLLLSPERGLMFWTPFTVMIAMGVKPLFQWSKSLFIIITIFSLLHLCAISGYYMPDGGLALGPRHLGPVLPLFAPLAAIGVSRSPTVGYVLAVISVLLIAAGTLISALTPSHISNPLWNYYAPRLLSGRFTHTILGQIGLGREIGGLATLWVIILLPFIIARTKLFTDVK